MKDRIYHWIAMRMPKRLVYWCAIVVGAKATSGSHGHQEVPSLTFFEAIERWEK